MIPVTVITGTLGAGKTTIIRNLVEQLDQSYKTMWLKNEYGDVNIDSELAKESNIETKEILNGCLCCVLVGKLHQALEEIVNNYKLDRLIIETAGTAYPGPIITELNKVPGLKLDGLIKVVDALNFEKFFDKSFLAKKEARFVDLVIINKVSLVEADQLDFVEDEVYELFPNKTIIKTEDGKISNDILLGIDAKQITNRKLQNTKKHSKIKNQKSKESISNINLDNQNSSPEARTMKPAPEYHEHIDTFSFTSDKTFKIKDLENFLEELNSNDFYRIKGIFKTEEGFKLLNYVLGRYTWQKLDKYNGESKVIFMGNGILGLQNEVGNIFGL